MTRYARSRLSVTESRLQSDIITALCLHPGVAWAMAVTTGQFKVKGGYISTGHYATEDMSRKTGMSDILGQLSAASGRPGAVLAVEVKLPGEEPTQEQRDFMAIVERNGGVSGWATSVDEALEIVHKATQK